MVPKPDFAPLTPGELLQEEFLSPLGMSADDLAARAELPPERVRDLLAGRINVDAHVSTALGRALGMSPQFWMNAQADYDAELRSGIDQ